MNSREFHLSDILSITTGRLVSTRHMDGVYDILNYMGNDNYTTMALPIASDKYKPMLEEKYPHLTSQALSKQLKELDQALKITNDSHQTVNQWIDKMTQEFGEFLSVPQFATKSSKYRL